MIGSYRATEWGNGFFTVDLVTKNHEEPVRYLSPAGIRYDRFSDLETVKKVIEQHRRKQKVCTRLKILWFNETTGEFY